MSFLAAISLRLIIIFGGFQRTSVKAVAAWTLPYKLRCMTVKSLGSDRKMNIFVSAHESGGCERNLWGRNFAVRRLFRLTQVDIELVRYFGVMCDGRRLTCADNVSNERWSSAYLLEINPRKRARIHC